MDYKKSSWKKQLGLVALGATATGLGIFIAMRFRTARPDEVLVRSGMFIKNTQVGRQFVQWPYQHIKTVYLKPTPFNFILDAKTTEKYEFKSPVSFTIGPNSDSESLKKFAMTLHVMSDQEFHKTITDIISGQSRAMAASMRLEDIFSGRNEFSTEVSEKIQKELDKFGLKVYNANIAKLDDTEGSNYFGSIAQIISSKAKNEADISVADYVKRGEIGSKERERDKRIRIVALEAEAKRAENERQSDIIISTAQLEKIRAEQSLIANYARIQSESDAEVLRLERERQIQEARLNAENAQKQADEMPKAVAEASVAIKLAEGESNAIRIRADAELYRMRQEAEGKLSLAIAQASGSQKQYEAMAKGINDLLSRFNGDANAMLNYLMIDKSQNVMLAEKMAQAFQNMNPNITMWTNNGGEASSNMTDFFKTVAKTFSTIQQQTGVQILPSLVSSKTNITS